jgi:hypothetical protein
MNNKIKKNQGHISIVGLLTVLAVAIIAAASIYYVVQSDKTTNSNTASVNSGNVNQLKNVNVSDTIANEQVRSNLMSADGHAIDETSGELTKTSVGGVKEKIELPFIAVEYHGEVTPWGSLFWQRGESKTIKFATFNDTEFNYEAGVKPDFRFYNFETKQFTTLPEANFLIGEQKYDQVYFLHYSVNEPKLLIEVGEYDTADPAFEPGMIGSEPVKTRGLVYDIATNKYETVDPLTPFLDLAKTYATRWYNIAWNSASGVLIGAPGGEGCGRYDNVMVVDYTKSILTKVGGVSSFDFTADLCNPMNDISPDKKWFILEGETTKGDYAVYLFATDGSSQPTKIIRLNSATKRYDKTWDTSETYPVIKYLDGAVANFQTSSGQNSNP